MLAHPSLRHIRERGREGERNKSNIIRQCNYIQPSVRRILLAFSNSISEVNCLNCGLILSTSNTHVGELKQSLT